MAHKRGDYGGRQRDFASERERLGQLAAALDPDTQQRLARLGAGPGWRCLEIGAAEGSLARWLARRTAPGGRVVACDIDLRFLEARADPAIELRELDIRSGSLERGAFDLACCRTLLLHLEDPVAALARMRDSLAPGGWLYAEEPDLCLHEALDPDHPDAEVFARFHRTLYAGVRARRSFDTRFGRTLPGCFEALGLREVDCELRAKIQRGDGPAARNQIAILPLLAEPLLAAGELARDELARVQALYRDPGFQFVSGVQVAVWGRGPGGGSGGRPR